MKPSSSSLAPAILLTCLVVAAVPFRVLGADTMPHDLSGLGPLTLVDESTLGEIRGGAVELGDFVNVQSIQSMRSEVNGSSIEAGQVVSGSVSFANHALNDFRGIGLFNIVTGNNNAVDAAIGVTFNLR